MGYNILDPATGATGLDRGRPCVWEFGNNCGNSRGAGSHPSSSNSHWPRGGGGHEKCQQNMIIASWGLRVSR